MTEIPSADFAAALGDDKRAEQRHALHWPILLARLTPHAAVVSGHTTELSLGGARAVADSNFAVGETIACRLTVQPRRGNASLFDVDVSARVAHAAYSSRAQAFEIGLQFQEFRGDGRARLADVFVALEKAIAPKDVRILKNSR